MRMLIAAAILPSALLAATPNASGSLQIQGKTIVMKYASAVQFPDWFDKTKMGTRLVVSDVPIPAAAMSETIDLMNLAQDGKMHAIQFEFGASGNSVSMSILSDKVEGSLSGSSNFDAKSLKVYTPVRIEGAMVSGPKKMFDMTYSYDVRFAADIAPRVVAAPPTAADTAAAAKAGSAQAYLAFTAALQSGNKAKMLELASPKVRQMMDQPDFVDKLSFVQAMTPKNIRVLKAEETGSDAKLTVSGVENGKTKHGTVTMQRLQGKWFMVKESWKSTM